ncbi:MAG: hypothetical protein V4607_02130 [Pseudomonadota bacterium]
MSNCREVDQSERQIFRQCMTEFARSISDASALLIRARKQGVVFYRHPRAKSESPASAAVVADYPPDMPAWLRQSLNAQLLQHKEWVASVCLIALEPTA